MKADRCFTGRAPRGWWCSRTPGHEGPCAARPLWWNQAKSARRYRRTMRRLLR